MLLNSLEYKKTIVKSCRSNSILLSNSYRLTVTFLLLNFDFAIKLVLVEEKMKKSFVQLFLHVKVLSIHVLSPVLEFLSKYKKQLNYFLKFKKTSQIFAVQLKLILVENKFK